MNCLIFYYLRINIMYILTSLVDADKMSRHIENCLFKVTQNNFQNKQACYLRIYFISNTLNYITTDKLNKL